MSAAAVRAHVRLRNRPCSNRLSCPPQQCAGRPSPFPRAGRSSAGAEEATHLMTPVRSAGDGAQARVGDKGEKWDGT